MNPFRAFSAVTAAINKDAEGSVPWAEKISRSEKLGAGTSEVGLVIGACRLLEGNREGPELHVRSRYTEQTGLSWSDTFADSFIHYKPT
jgi:hypothetical protein